MSDYKDFGEEMGNDATDTSYTSKEDADDVMDPAEEDAEDIKYPVDEDADDAMHSTDEEDADDVMDPAEEDAEDVMHSTEEEDEKVTIDLTGGFADTEGEDETKATFTEVLKKKKKHHINRTVAAMLALTVLNLALFGGAFMLGKNYGTGSKSVSSKQDLVDNLKSNDSGQKVVNVANTQNEISTTEIAKKVGPAVVRITSTINGQMSIFGQPTSSQSEGSGIILSQDGYIVTNNHVVDGASTVKVMLNTGTEYEAKLIGKDTQTDLAVIKIEPKEALTNANFGDSNNIEVGERAVAIGNPMGLEFFGSVTEGIISAKNRNINVNNRTLNVIQTDAAINSGNSGGALINRFGEVIGINSIKVATSGVEGMGFAIPSSEAKPIIADLISHGYVKGRPVIGISTRDVSEYMAQSYSWPQGVQVMEITSENARTAGFQQGDIITEVDGEKISDTDTLNQIKNKHNPGDVLNMKVYKYATGRTEDLKITLSEQLPG